MARNDAENSGCPGPAPGSGRSRLEATLQKLLGEAHDEFLPGNAYVEWVDRERNIIKTGLGAVAE